MKFFIIRKLLFTFVKFRRTYNREKRPFIAAVLGGLQLPSFESIKYCIIASLFRSLLYHSMKVFSTLHILH